MPIGARPVFIGRQTAPEKDTFAPEPPVGAPAEVVEPEARQVLAAPLPPKLRPQPPEEPRPVTSGSIDELVDTIAHGRKTAQAKVREEIVAKQRKSGHCKDDTVRMFESHADIVDGTIDRPSFKSVITDWLRLSMGSAELDMLYTVLGPDEEDRVKMSRVIKVLHTKERWDGRKYFPKQKAVDPELLRHYKGTIPRLSGASLDERAAPRGAGRDAPSPDARTEFRSEVQASMSQISARKDEAHQRDEMARTGEMALNASMSRHRLPPGTTDLICGASTSRMWPPPGTLPSSPRGPPKAQSAREGPVSAGQFLSGSSGDLVSMSASPLNSPRREFSAHLLPTPGSPRAGFNGVPGVRVPAKHHYEQPAGAQMDPLWIPPKAGKGPNTTFSKGNGWNLQPAPKSLFTKEFQSTLQTRAQDHDSQAVSQTIGQLRRKKEHFSHGTRFFDPRTEYGCAVEIGKNGLVGRSFGDREGHRFKDELPKRNSWNPSIFQAPTLPAHQAEVFGYETKADPHPKHNPKVHWNSMVSTARHSTPRTCTAHGSLHPFLPPSHDHVLASHMNESTCCCCLVAG
jgi:hypothetical protein